MRLAVAPPFQEGPLSGSQWMAPNPNHRAGRSGGPDPPSLVSAAYSNDQCDGDRAINVVINVCIASNRITSRPVDALPNPPSVFTTDRRRRPFPAQ